MKPCLVFNAKSTIGREVVGALVRLGVPVRAGVHSLTGTDELRKQGCEVVAYDYFKPQDTEKMFQGAETVFLASPPTQEFLEPIAAFLQLAKKAGVGHVVRLSAFGADPNSPLPTAAQHGKVYALLKDAGIPWTVLEPVFFMDNFITVGGATIRGQGTFYGASNDVAVAYISSRTIGEVAAHVLKNPKPHSGNTYVLTGPSAIKDSEAAAIISKTIGKDVKYTNLTPDVLTQGLVGNGVPSWLAQFVVALEGAKANGWLSNVSPSVEQILGSSGENLDDFIQRHRSALT